VAVVSERFRREHLAARSAAIGAALLLDGEPFTVVGVMSDAFQFPIARRRSCRAWSEGRTDLWRPIAAPGQIPQGRSSVVARLTPGASIANAESELRVVAARIAADTAPAERPARLSGSPLAKKWWRRSCDSGCSCCLAPSSSCCCSRANIANLSLVRTTLRRQELAAGRARRGAGRLARQLLARQPARPGRRRHWLDPRRLGRFGDGASRRRVSCRAPTTSGFDWTVFAFLAAVCMMTAVLVSLAPIVATRRGYRCRAAGIGRTRDDDRDRGVRDTLSWSKWRWPARWRLARRSSSARQCGGQTPIDWTHNVVTFHLGHRMVPGDNGSSFTMSSSVRALRGVQSARRHAAAAALRTGDDQQLIDFQVRGGIDDRDVSHQPPLRDAGIFRNAAHSDPPRPCLRCIRSAGGAAGDSDQRGAGAPLLR
jgi:hypothetical protein